MKSVLVQISDPVYHSLLRVTAKRKRAEFIREAIVKAIMEAEEERTRLAYLKHPDTETCADDWREPEEWKP